MWSIRHGASHRISTFSGISSRMLAVEAWLQGNVCRPRSGSRKRRACRPNGWRRRRGKTAMSCIYGAPPFQSYYRQDLCSAACDNARSSRPAIIIDEADRLKTASLEQVRDIFDQAARSGAHRDAGFGKAAVALFATLFTRRLRACVSSAARARRCVSCSKASGSHRGRLTQRG